MVGHTAPQAAADPVARAATPEWRVPPGNVLCMHAWDDELVVYHKPSGDTHLLGPLARHLLLALRDAPLVSGSAAIFATTEDAMQDAALSADAIFLELEALGLVERIVS